MTPQRLTLATVVLAVVAVAAILIVPRVTGGPDAATAAAAGDFAGQPRLGDPAAPVTIAVFEDFRCPACASFETNVFPSIRREYVDTGRANVVFVNFVVLGPSSEHVARLGECVFRQSETAFWEMKGPLYRVPQGELDTARRARELVLTYAPGIDAGQLDACMADESSLASVREDTQLAQRLGLRGTPSVLVDGTQVNAAVADLRRAIDAAAD